MKKILIILMLFILSCSKKDENNLDKYVVKVVSAEVIDNVILTITNKDNNNRFYHNLMSVHAGNYIDTIGLQKSTNYHFKFSLVFKKIIDKSYNGIQIISLDDNKVQATSNLEGFNGLVEFNFKSK